MLDPASVPHLCLAVVDLDASVGTQLFATMAPDDETQKAAQPLESGRGPGVAPTLTPISS